ncbi:hypothetical protein AB0L53_20175 [Nonomuraea sp. NPDC052129]|uniref:hypothetical protein n=1 Tax=Nonomuraea sp. NPDC052129 TaxID=3154651 RepID=UPI0034217269
MGHVTPLRLVRSLLLDPPMADTASACLPLVDIVSDDLLLIDQVSADPPMVDTPLVDAGCAG